jgi:hypothetical protein
MKLRRDDMGIKLNDVLRGNASKNVMMRFVVPLFMGASLFCLLIAYLLYPYIASNPYNWTTSMISRLGWPHENQFGWIFFSFSLILLATMIVILNGYYHARLSKLHRQIANLIRLLMVLCSIAGFLLGAIPNFKTDDKIFVLIHGLNAVILMSGLYLVSCFLLLFVSSRKSRDRMPISRKMVGFYAIVLVYGFTCVILLVIFLGGRKMDQFIYDPSIPVIFQGPVWEWQAFFTGIFLIVVPVYILSEKIDVT